ncbi:MAG: thiamine phosphate synthase [Smithellaceae bacterium]|nr:thiamine phosphate synthase [Smithellaceae bacterium]
MQITSDHRLYLVLTEEYGMGKPLVSIAQQAIAGGIDILQMREKQRSREELVSLGKALGVLCRKNGVVFIINDDPHLACELDADGVHLGQEDMARYPIGQVRRIVGPDKIIGLSTHSPEQFRHGNEADVDYLAFGPVFPTQTKDYSIGTGHVKSLLQAAVKPVFLIGGIHAANLDIVLSTGATRVALIRDIMQAADIPAQVNWYKEKLMSRKGMRI